MFGKGLTTLYLIVYLVFGSLLPIFSTKVQAQWVVSDPAHTALTAAENTRKTIKDTLNSIAMIAARVAIQRIVTSTVNWASNGFQGNPAYAINPEQYFADTADMAAGEIVANSTLNGGSLSFLCSPFETQIRLALRRHYLQEPQYICTLSGVIQNLEAFYGNFNEGGWDAWFAISQNSGNNPYDAYMETQIALDSRIAQIVGLRRDELNRNFGFLSFKKCDGFTVPASISLSGQEECQNAAGQIVEKRTVTPGVVIKEQLDRVLPSGLESLITVNNVEQLIQAFATGLLNRYVFGPQGLFSDGPGLPIDNPRGGNSQSQTAVGVDVDGDNKNDIIDTDGDGAPDTCIYGGTYPACLAGSANATTTAATVWGYVFEDTNRNGTKDNSEPTPSGISVYLKSADGLQDLGTSQTFNGLYSFAELGVGQNYLVGITLPSGFTATTPQETSARAEVLVPNRPVKNFGIILESQ